MLSHKEKCFKVHHDLSLENLVPADNFYRQLEAKLDLSFVRDLVQDCYSLRLGRPSIDPVVFFKLQLIMFFEGIRSERQLMDMVNLNLAHRWYTSYDLDEVVPDHSSLSKIRTRYGLAVFQCFFEKIVELCIEAGLVWGKELYFDGTKVRANGAISKRVPRFYYEAKQHLQDLFPEERDELQLSSEASIPGDIRGLVSKYDGTRFLARRKHWYERKADIWINETDTDATSLSWFIGDKAKLGYHNHYVVDGGKARIILAALVTPAAIMDNTPMLDLARWVRFRWQLNPKIAVADAKYGTVTNVVNLEQDGIAAFIPRSDFSQRNAYYPPDRFQYDPERNVFVCPQGQLLTLYKRSYSELQWVYRADARICNQCPVKAECTGSKSGRYMRRWFFQDVLDRVDGYQKTEAYKKAMRKRQVWIEPMFGEAKQWHNMQKFRWRGLVKVNIQGLLTAAGQNIKRLLKAQRRPQRPDPAYTVALKVGLSPTPI